MQCCSLSRARASKNFGDDALSSGRVSEASRQRTLVAWHGSNKPSELSELLVELLGELESQLGDGFVPYELEQIHATLIGLEHVRGDPTRHRDFVDFGGDRPMNLAGLRDFLLADLQDEFFVRFAGFAPDEAPFKSRGKSPYERSFSVQGDKLVLVGWPEEPERDARWPLRLDLLRRAGRAFGVRHRWHVDDAIDNDCYLRLGLLARPLERPDREALAARLRVLLSDRGPVRVRFDADSLTWVSYLDTRLPRETTETCGFAQGPLEL